MQEEGCWQHKGETKLQAQANPLMMKENLETWAMRWRHNRVKTENGTKKELHVLKQQLKEEHELHKQVNELQEEHEHE